MWVTLTRTDWVTILEGATSRFSDWKRRVFEAKPTYKEKMMIEYMLYIDVKTYIAAHFIDV